MSRDSPGAVNNRFTWSGLGELGQVFNGAPAISMHVWLYPRTRTPGANDIQPIFQEQMAAGSSILLTWYQQTMLAHVAGRSQNSDEYLGFTTTGLQITFEQWQSFGGVIDFANDMLHVYINGEEESGAASFGRSDYLHTNHGSLEACFLRRAQSSPSSRYALLGMATHGAIWNYNIGRDAFASLAKGYHPRLVSPRGLRIFLPCNETGNPQDHGPARTTIIETGTIPRAADPPLIYPARVHSRFISVPAIGLIRSRVVARQSGTFDRRSPVVVR